MQQLLFHIPNFVLAALTYTLLGRLVLGFFVPENWENYIWNAFRRLTDPVLAAVRVITPSALTHHAVLVFAVLWLFLLRFAFTLIMLRIGLAPKIG